MSIKVIIPTALRQHTDNEDELQLNARTVSDALKELVTAFPNLRRHLYSESGRLRNFINIYLNEEDIRYKEGESTVLKDGDTLMIVPAVAGGAHASDDEEHDAKVSFSSSEFARYSRHLIMPEVGLEGQSKLKSASVLIIGAGGLGTPSAMYLAAAGVGRIGIVDFDTIEKSNLHRQVLYSEQDIGKSKADVAQAEAPRDQPQHQRRGPQGEARLLQRAGDPRSLRHHPGRDRQLPDALPRERRLRPSGQAQRLREHLQVRGPGLRLLREGGALLSLPVSRTSSAWTCPFMRGGWSAGSPPRDNGKHSGSRGDRPDTRKR